MARTQTNTKHNAGQPCPCMVKAKLSSLFSPLSSLSPSLSLPASEALALPCLSSQISVALEGAPIQAPYALTPAFLVHIVDIKERGIPNHFFALFLVLRGCCCLWRSGASLWCPGVRDE